MKNNLLRAFIFPVCLVISYITSGQQKHRGFTDGSIAKPFTYYTRANRATTPNTKRNAYRTYEGIHNNLGKGKTEWGAADIALWREIPASYGAGDPLNEMGGSSRPSARRISNLVIDEPVTQFNERELSSFIYVWGQFIDHDMSLTPTGTTEYEPVLLPEGEAIFTESIPFYRSAVREGTGISNMREQSNLNTAWIDASMVYGSDSARARWLRTGKNGKMKTSAGSFLPYNTKNGQIGSTIDANAPSMANDADHTVVTFVAGDVRAAEHPGILALHTLFVREHNRICDRLISEGVREDEEIFQKARKEVGAIIQAITYQEFLPAIGITLSRYSGYKPGLRPDLTNTFATAAYRLGHTMVADDLLLFDNNCAEVAPGEFDLVEVFWAPQTLIETGMEPFLKGFAAHTQYETDTKINSVLRNFLFGSPNDPVRFGVDLGSLNIQRGRDHGLPDYNTTRRFYTGSGISSFSQITRDAVLSAALERLYGNVNNIDLWIGVLAEDHLPGKSVGKTLYRMLRKQFESLRDGDFYFYLNDPYLPKPVRKNIMATRFSDVLKRNTTLTNLQANVFFTEECPGSEDEAVSKSNQAEDLNINTSANKMISGLYPNPTSRTLTLRFNPTTETSRIQVFNVDGKVVNERRVPAGQSQITIDVSPLPNGIYMISISQGSRVASHRFVKIGTH